MNRLQAGIFSFLMVGLVFFAQAAEEFVFVPSSKNNPASQQPSNTRLTFMDSKLFDAKLAKELESGVDTVDIDVSGHVSLNNIPPRMDKWMVKSAETGRVELLPIEQAPKQKFLFSLVSMVFSAFSFLSETKEEKMYDQVKGYDTKVYYKKDGSGESLIERIVLTRRKPQ